MLAVHKNSKDLASPRRWSQSAGSLPTAQLGFKLGHPIPGCQNKAGPTNVVFRARALKQGPSLGAWTNFGKLRKKRGEVSQGDKSAFCPSEKSVAALFPPPLGLSCHPLSASALPAGSHRSSRSPFPSRERYPLSSHAEVRLDLS